MQTNTVIAFPAAGMWPFYGKERLGWVARAIEQTSNVATQTHKYTWYRQGHLFPMPG